MSQERPLRLFFPASDECWAATCYVEDPDLSERFSEEAIRKLRIGILSGKSSGDGGSCEDSGCLAWDVSVVFLINDLVPNCSGVVLLAIPMGVCMLSIVPACRNLLQNRQSLPKLPVDSREHVACS